MVFICNGVNIPSAYFDWSVALSGVAAGNSNIHLFGCYKFGQWRYLEWLRVTPQTFTYSDAISSDISNQRVYTCFNRYIVDCFSDDF